MITLAMAAEVRAQRSDVWRALTQASETSRWRPGLERVVSVESGWPRPGHAMVWQSRLHELPITVRQTPLSLVPGDRLRSDLRVGLFRIEETLTLAASGERAGTTRVGIRVVARSEMPMVGGALDRFGVRRFATDLAAATLQAIRDWCERGTGSVSATEPVQPAARG